MPAGRPSSYNPEFCDTVELLGAEGMSYTEIAVNIGVHKDTLYEWSRVHPEFSVALRRAREVCQAWWERQGRISLANRDFNAPLWNKNMSCRFKDDWRETVRTESTGADGGPVQVVTETFDAFTRRITGLVARASETSGNSETEPS